MSLQSKDKGVKQVLRGQICIISKNKRDQSWASMTVMMMDLILTLAKCKPGSSVIDKIHHHQIKTTASPVTLRWSKCEESSRFGSQWDVTQLTRCCYRVKIRKVEF
jgi:hypothetical protein